MRACDGACSARNLADALPSAPGTIIIGTKGSSFFKLQAKNPNPSSRPERRDTDGARQVVRAELRERSVPF